MIDKLQLLQQVLSTLRSTREPAAPTRRPPSAASGRGVTLEEQLRRRIGAIEGDDPRRRRRMLRMTIEGCLAAEWGGDLAADPAFHEIVDNVVQQLECDPALQSLIDETLAALAVPGR